MASEPNKPTVLCVDDNLQVADALRVKLRRDGSFEWQGWLCEADDLVEVVKRDRPKLVLLDLDLPGRDPLVVTAELHRVVPSSRVVVFSGLVTRDLVERALDAGAWGYVSKNDGEAELLSAMHKVGGGDVALSPEAAALYYGR
jgi:DNA-binding NarL/FixJ family response regulator